MSFLCNLCKNKNQGNVTILNMLKDHAILPKSDPDQDEKEFGKHWSTPSASPSFRCWGKHQETEGPRR